MGTILQLVGDSRANPKRVDMRPPGSGVDRAGDLPVSIPLNTQSLLRLAGLAALSGFRVVDVRIDDLSRDDDLGLRDLKRRILADLNSGDSEIALDELLDSKEELIVSGLVLEDRESHSRLYVNRTGEVESARPGVFTTTKLRDAVIPHVEIFRR